MLGPYVSRVKGKSLRELKVAIFSQNEWSRGYIFSSQEKVFFLEAFFVFRESSHCRDSLPRTLPDKTNECVSAS